MPVAPGRKKQEHHTCQLHLQDGLSLFIDSSGNRAKAYREEAWDALTYGQKDLYNSSKQAVSTQNKLRVGKLPYV
jgi:hypothetical protein